MFHAITGNPKNTNAALQLVRRLRALSLAHRTGRKPARISRSRRDATHILVFSRTQ
jgi:hypothetical protein